MKYLIMTCIVKCIIMTYITKYIIMTCITKYLFMTCIVKCIIMLRMLWKTSSWRIITLWNKPKLIYSRIKFPSNITQNCSPPRPGSSGASGSKTRTAIGSWPTNRQQRSSPSMTSWGWTLIFSAALKRLLIIISWWWQRCCDYDGDDSDDGDDDDGGKR